MPPPPLVHSADEAASLAFRCNPQVEEVMATSRKAEAALQVALPEYREREQRRGDQRQDHAQSPVTRCIHDCPPDRQLRREPAPARSRPDIRLLGHGDSQRARERGRPVRIEPADALGRDGSGEQRELRDIVQPVQRERYSCRSQDEDVYHLYRWCGAQASALSHCAGKFHVSVRLTVLRAVSLPEVACALGPQASSPMYVVLPDCSCCPRAVQPPGEI